MISRPYLRPAVAGVRAGLLPYEVRKRDLDGGSKHDQQAEVRIAGSVLDPVDGSMIHSDEPSQFHLCQIGVHACMPDAFADRLSLGDDPVWLWRDRHYAKESRSSPIVIAWPCKKLDLA